MLQDLRFAVRTLLRSPGFTLTAALTLALGIGATSLMFSVVNAVLLRPLPYADQERLMLVFNVNTNAPDANMMRVTPLDFDDYRARSQTFESMAAHIGTGFTFGGPGEPELVIGQMVTPDFFRVLGVQPALGRSFRAEEFSPGRENAMLLSQRLWRRRFGGDPSVVGTQVNVNGRVFTIAGVMPAGFEYFGRRYELWTPLPSPRTPELPPLDRTAHYLQVVGRLKPSVSPGQAHTEIAGIAGALAAEYPDSNRNLAARVTPLEDFTVRDAKAPLQVLLGAVGLVVLIACANVTNLLLARATARHREVAIRQALGAGRWRLVRQFFAETAILYGLGACGALAVASWGAAAVVSLGPAEVPRLADTALDGRVLAATLLLSLVTAVVFGLAPAVQGSSADPADALRAGRTASAGRGRQRFRVALVVAEVSLSVVLLFGAGLALHSLSRLTSVDPGFDAGGQLTFSVVMPPRKYANGSSMIAFTERLTEQLASSPGVEHVGATTHLPLTGQNLENSFTVDGFVPARPDDVPIAGMRGVTPAYFAALGARLKSGRAFSQADRADSEPVAIVNEAFAKRYFHDQNPIGKRVREGGYPEWRTVVGVIADVKHLGPAAEARPEVSLPVLATHLRIHDQVGARPLFRGSGQDAGRVAGVVCARARRVARSGHVIESSAVHVGARLGRHLGAALPHDFARHVCRTGHHAGQRRRLRRAVVLRHSADAGNRDPRGSRRHIGRYPQDDRRPWPGVRRRRAGRRAVGGCASGVVDAVAPLPSQAARSHDDPCRERRPGARGHRRQLSAGTACAADRAADRAAVRLSVGGPPRGYFNRLVASKRRKSE